jgi:hypothetical protein
MSGERGGLIFEGSVCAGLKNVIKTENTFFMPGVKNAKATYL